MAMTRFGYCGCGAPLMVYMPKRLLFKGLATEEELRAIDEEEVAAGEVEALPKWAASMGMTFVNLEETSVCGSCGRRIRLPSLSDPCWQGRPLPENSRFSIRA